MHRPWIVRGSGVSDRRASSTRIALATGFAIVFGLALLAGIGAVLFGGTLAALFGQGLQH